MQKRQSKIVKRKTSQGKALEKRAARSFMDVLQETNLESLPPHIPTYLRAAVDPPSTSSRWHYCSVCCSSANYTCVSVEQGSVLAAAKSYAMIRTA
ncbi:hypothetical protein BDA96_08G008600 [Sorghum bicolor]|uniref:Uncharacterized protein n=2 Tax=Sorghum bicolor TaxID=4558 RepID=A0A1B6PAX1_SORBI|nr:hypothetical protein BDA96_08G008600 [Sorghum bicolor]KXG22781.1 hypothetical protein SORBI_3008G007500 [Sorghum bicolor]